MDDSVRERLSMTTQKRRSTLAFLTAAAGLTAFVVLGAHGSPPDPYAEYKPERMQGGYGEQLVRIEQYPELYRFDSPEEVAAEIGRPVWRLSDAMGRESLGYLVSRTHPVPDRISVQEFFEDFRFSQMIYASPASAARQASQLSGRSCPVRGVEGWVTEVSNLGYEYSPARLTWIEGDTIFKLEGRSVEVFAEDLRRMAESMELQIEPGGGYRRYPGIGKHWWPPVHGVADPTAVPTLYERVAQAGMRVDSFEIAANHVVFPVADLGMALHDAESIIVDDRLLGPDGSLVTRYDKGERWINVFMPDGTAIARGLQDWESADALVESEMSEVGAEEWKHPVDLDGLDGIAWSLGEHGAGPWVFNGRTMLDVSIIPHSLVAWSVDGVTTILRSEHATHEQLLPLALEIRGAQRASQPGD